MLRVGIIAGTYRPDRCGVVHYTARLRAALAERGVRATVLTTRDAAGAAGDPRVVGAVDGWGLDALLALARAVRRCGVDLLHVQFAPGSYGFKRAIALLPAALAAARWRGPLVTTVHEYGGWEWRPPIPSGPRAALARLGGRRGWWDAEAGLLLTRSAAIVVTNEVAAAAIRARLPAAAERLHLIPLSPAVEPVEVDRAQARRALLQRFGWPEDARVAAFFGFVHPVKGLETLIAAFALLADQDRRARLLVVGGWESLALSGDGAARYRASLDEQVARRGLGGRVRFTGYLPAEEASLLLAGADVGVLPLNHGVTGKSSSLLTLLAHGLPVVATRHDPPDPGLEALPGVTPVPPRDPAALAAALQRALAEPARLSRLPLAGGLDWEATAARYLALYRSALGRDWSGAGEMTYTCVD